MQFWKYIIFTFCSKNVKIDNFNFVNDGLNVINSHFIIDKLIYIYIYIYIYIK